MWPFKKKIQPIEVQPKKTLVHLTDDEAWRLCILHDALMSKASGQDWTELYEYWTYIHKLCGNLRGSVRISFDKGSGRKPKVEVTHES